MYRLTTWRTWKTRKNDFIHSKNLQENQCSVASRHEPLLVDNPASQLRPLSSLNKVWEQQRLTTWRWANIRANSTIMIKVKDRQTEDNIGSLHSRRADRPLTWTITNRYSTSPCNKARRESTLAICSPTRKTLVTSTSFNSFEIAHL